MIQGSGRFALRGCRGRVEWGPRNGGSTFNEWKAMENSTRKVIIDCDPGIDDAVALCLALAADDIDLVGITGVEGCVSADQANRNIQTILEHLDPDKWPRVGSASATAGAPAVDTRYLHGDDGLGNLGSTGTAYHHPHGSDKLICDLVRLYPNEVSLVMLGPATNVARAFRRDPGIESLVNRLVIMGGAVDGIGNITANAEFNFYFDPESARSVLNSRTTKLLVPLDVTRQLAFYLDLLDVLPDQSSRAGLLLRRMLSFAFRAYRQRMGQEGILLNDLVALLAFLEADLFETESMAGDVEIAGELSRGMTLFDRRSPAEWRPNVEVARAVHESDLRDRFLLRLKRASNRFTD